MFAKEPPMRVMDVSVTHNEIAEKLNGRLAHAWYCKCLDFLRIYW